MGFYELRGAPLFKKGSWKIFNAQVPMSNRFGVVIILQSDVTGAGSPLWIDPAKDHQTIHADCVVLSDAGDFVLIPAAQRQGVRLGGSLKGVNRPRAPGGVLGIRIADFHLVPLMDGVPRIGFWIGKPKE